MTRTEVTPPTCRSCGAPIVWGTTYAGKRMPIDATPTAMGNVRLFGDGRAMALGLTDIEAYRQAGIALYTSHFATCPHAARHRRAS